MTDIFKKREVMRMENIGKEKIWWYAQNGKQMGPCSVDEIRQLAATGRLAHSDLVWRPGIAAWQPAASIDGLLLSAPAIAPVAASAEAVTEVLPMPVPGMNSHPAKRKEASRRSLMVVAGIFLLVVAGLAGFIALRTKEPPQVLPEALLFPTQGSTVEPGKVYKGCPDCPALVVIPGGEFMMGSSNGAENEKPPHVVKIQPLALGRTEVTIGEWKAVMGNYSGSNAECGSDCPVNVKRDEIIQFITKLNAKTGQEYRLPSEAEWEYAARAGGAGKWSFGDDEAQLGNYAWYKKNSNDRIRVVGQKKPNAFGLYDMLGNQIELVEDCWHENYQGAPTDGSAWTLNCKKSRDHYVGVRRGGMYHSDSQFLSSSNRTAHEPIFGAKEDRAPIYFESGFRLARSLTPAQPQVASTNPIEACVQAKVAQTRKEMGQDHVIRMDILQEWEDECGKQQHAGTTPLTWCSQVTLTGVLQTAKHQHPNGQMFPFFFISLPEPIKLSASDCDGIRVESESSRDIQIKASSDELAAQVGKTVTLSGKLIPPENAYHVHPILLETPSIKATVASPTPGNAPAPMAANGTTLFQNGLTPKSGRPLVMRCEYSDRQSDLVIYFEDTSFLQYPFMSSRDVNDGKALNTQHIFGRYSIDGLEVRHQNIASRPEEIFARVMKLPTNWSRAGSSIFITYRFSASDSSSEFFNKEQASRVVDGRAQPKDMVKEKCALFSPDSSNPQEAEATRKTISEAYRMRNTVPSGW